MGHSERGDVWGKRKQDLGQEDLDVGRFVMNSAGVYRDAVDVGHHLLPSQLLLLLCLFICRCFM